MTEHSIANCESPVLEVLVDVRRINGVRPELHRLVIKGVLEKCIGMRRFPVSGSLTTLRFDPIRHSSPLLPEYAPKGNTHSFYSIIS